MATREADERGFHKEYTRLGRQAHDVCYLGKRRQKTAAPTDVSFVPTFEPARSGGQSETGGGPSSQMWYATLRYVRRRAVYVPVSNPILLGFLVKW